MKEAIFILLVIATLFALTAFRYRRQLRAAVGIWRMLRGVRADLPGREPGGVAQPSSGKLVSCTKCGTWSPEERAIRVPPNVYYCSRECVESFVSAG